MSIVWPSSLRRTGWPVACHTLWLKVAELCTFAARERTDWLRVSLLMAAYRGTATAAIMAITVTAVRSSVNVKPACDLMRLSTEAFFRKTRLAPSRGRVCDALHVFCCHRTHVDE